MDVFRDKQDVVQKQGDGEMEGKEEEERAAWNQGELDLENVDENGSSEPKTDDGIKETSS